jgi:DNA topoisomerase I
MRNLVIVESPAKAKTINKILGRDFHVLSSVGHVRDLPIKTMGVDIKNGFEPEYVSMPGKKKVIDELKKAAKEADKIYLAPDPDREGEAIAWHIRELLSGGANKNKPFLRVQYNEITPQAVRRAIENPGELNMPRVDAQQARRILDRIVGYMVSPVLWRRVRRGLSAGRVQSVALRLVCEREDEIRSFKPEAFWLMGARARKLVAPLDPFELRLARIGDEKADIRSAPQAEAIRSDLEGRSLRVAEIATREISRRAPPPFITSSLQQAASTFLGYAPKRTMSLAQKLYEGEDLGDGPVGLITYMRTDSFNIAAEALEACRGLIAGTFGPEYCPEKPNFFRSRASAQEAHEAIRPTDVGRTPESLSGRLDPSEWRLYKLIWDRFVASQMTPARIEQRTAKVHALPPEGGSTLYVFHASSSDVKFAGYMKLLGSELLREKEKEGDEDEPSQRLPPLAEGEPLQCLEWLTEQKETKPPSRYSEAALIKALESNGIGRPSTYAQIMSTLHDRSYVESQKKSLMPTDLGMEVNRLLVSTLEQLFNVAFTAEMEKRLDEVEEGGLQWRQMLAEFYARFEGWMEQTKEPPADQAAVKHLLDAMTAVTEWVPPVKSGKRTFSHEKFVNSIRDQLAEGKKPISRRQMETLARIAAEYREKTPALQEALKESGYEALLHAEPPKPPCEASIRKLELMAGVPLDEGGVKFHQSLKARVDGGRSLTPNQMRALDRMVLRNSAHIPDFESQRALLGLAESEPVGEDHESGPLLEAMKSVATWKPPVTRGRMTFDDRKFHDSLAQQFARRKALSDRQRAALKKMVARYREQIPGFDELAERLAIPVKRKAEGEGAQD